jgi:predicted PolB exonuclease-like 3'-5' exonuclease
MVKSFWRGVESYHRAKLVSFNGRGFDLPLLELAAFRFGCSGRHFFQSTRGRYGGNHLDLMDWLANYGAYRLAGGLDLLSKILGKPGKMNVSGDQVYEMFRAGRLQDINDYCMFDTLDTYFVFLRTRVLNGDLTLEQEHEVVVHAKTWLQTQITQLPGLNQYLNNWGDWEPWP